jgi:hypothetical protein
VGRSVIRSCAKLAYPMVQSMIEGSFTAQPGQEPPCELHGPHTWTEVGVGGGGRVQGKNSKKRKKKVGRKWGRGTLPVTCSQSSHTETPLAAASNMFMVYL